jgi:outer membrane protein assembly factor BamD
MLRRTLLTFLAIYALLWAIPAAAQKHSRKEARAEKQSQKEAAKDEGNSEAPDKVLYDRALHDIKKGHHEIARLTLQTLINTYPDSAYLAKAKLAIADSYYKEGGSANWAQAIAAYKDFIVFFPFLPQASYAQMQVAMTHFKQMEKPDRDQTEALAAEDEFQTFLEKYPNDPLVPKAEQCLREVQELLAEGDFRVGYFYYVKGDRRAAAGRLISVTKRYPLYSQSDKALWILGDIFEKSERKEIAATYYARIVREYPLSPLVPDAKQKLVAFSVPVPQPDPKALAWMQAEANAPRPHENLLLKPMELLKTGPGRELTDAARYGQPNLTPESNDNSGVDILSGGGESRIGAGGSSPTTGNTAVIEVATPGTGASGGSNAPPAGGAAVSDPAPTTPSSAPSNDPGSGAESGSNIAPSVAPSDAQPPAANPPAPGAQPQTSSPAADGTAAPGTTANGTDTKKDDKKNMSSSKKKKGLKKLIPW